MSGLIPHSELTKQAITWICDQQASGVGSRTLRQLIDEASARFNLGPLDEEFLTRFFADKAKQGENC